MSDEKTGSEESDEKAAGGGGEAAAAPERRDEEGLPLDRKPTLDDVRGGSGSGRATAVSCTLVVLLVLAGFFLVRVLLMR